jgi:hypothetical protein
MKTLCEGTDEMRREEPNSLAALMRTRAKNPRRAQIFVEIGFLAEAPIKSSEDWSDPERPIRSGWIDRWGSHPEGDLWALGSSGSSGAQWSLEKDRSNQGGDPSSQELTLERRPSHD